MFKFGKPEGLGVEVTRFDEYCGDFVKGVKEGVGCLREFSGFTYTGCFLQGKKHGFGIDRSNQTTDYYAGEFSSDKRSGMGRLKGPSYEFTGGFLDGDYSGYGRLKTDTFLYLGNW